jgi:hypothetical protein
LQHSYFELCYIRIQRGRLQGLCDGVTGLDRVDDLVDPQTRCAVTRVGLLVVGALGRFVQFFLFFLAQLGAAALELLYFNLN